MEQPQQTALEEIEQKTKEADAAKSKAADIAAKAAQKALEAANKAEKAAEKAEAAAAIVAAKIDLVIKAKPVATITEEEIKARNEIETYLHELSGGLFTIINTKSFSVKIEPSGHSFRCSAECSINSTASGVQYLLPGGTRQLEADLRRNIRDYIKKNKPHWNADCVAGVTIKI